MREFSPATAAYFADREFMSAEVLLWIKPRNRSTGVVETIGLWTGPDNTEFTIGSEIRAYYGAGNLLALDPLRRTTGINVSTHRIRVSNLTAEAQLLIRGYDPRHAEVEIHRALFDRRSNLLIDEPHVIAYGYIDKVNISTPEAGGETTVNVDIASSARALTKGLSRYRSDASLKARAAEDRFREAATKTEAAEVPWGRD